MSHGSKFAIGLRVGGAAPFRERREGIVGLCTRVEAGQHGASILDGIGDDVARAQSERCADGLGDRRLRFAGQMAGDHGALGKEFPCLVKTVPARPSILPIRAGSSRWTPLSPLGGGADIHLGACRSGLGEGWVEDIAQSRYLSQTKAFDLMGLL